MMSAISKDYKQRFVSSSLTAVVLVTLFILAPYPLFHPLFTLVTAAIASAAIMEFSKLLKSKKIALNIRFLVSWTFAFCFALLLATYFPILHTFILVVIPLTLVVLFFTQLSNPKGSLERFSYTIFTLAYIAFPMGLMVDILYGFPEREGMCTGLFWLAYLIVATKVTDMSALFVGRTLGKKKLCPKISPNKTVVGAIGGLCGTSIISVIIALVMPYFGKTFISPFAALILGLLLASVAEIGDLLESLFKRDAKIDDSSNILPGLGGILDIIDSLLLTTPVLWAAMRILV